MKRNRINWLLGALMLLSSCSFLDVEPSYVVDAYLTTRLIDGDTLVAVNGYVQSNVQMKSARMYNVDNKFEYDLTQVYNNGLGLDYYADSAAYVDTFNAEGLVYFEVIHDDETVGLQPDYLYEDVIYPFVINKVERDTLVFHTGVGQNIHIDTNEDASFMNLFITYNDSIVYYRTYMSFDSVTTVNSNDVFWVGNFSPTVGDTYKIYMELIMMERNFAYMNELQCISYSTPYSFVWSDE